MQRYGLQLRTKPAASSSSRAPPPPARPLAAFADDDDDDVEAEILRQAAKKRALQKVEEQQKKAMEQDPSVFAYDEVYDDMKEKEARPKMQDKVVRESKYIAQLKEKAEQRKREQDIIYERKLQKERSKEDHLFGDKDKFVTSAYRKKLEEQQKWLEEERIRQLREEREDVTKKKDLSDFYFGLQKNVAFGAQMHGNAKHADPKKSDNKPEDKDTKSSSLDAEVSEPSPKRRRESSVGSERAKSVEEPSGSRSRDSTAAAPTEKNAADVPSNASQDPQNAQPAKITDDHYKRSDDALAAARARALARKKAKEQQL
ncbi:hypothetical protein BAE44_0017983 [Dichanthelium oligosanthes]|uniref:Nuclear speckle splicing regulatory protein 1 N-terminal domain-containing protein n=1 Tax=Dichanthelium oligosanthes TaxID=888268 RepID=A0A1E5V7G9_9POAL|nr:hypothetical protein BAE44_0017983 [Dichanthelium oligosanthes]